jgi:hypothetical protein
MPSLYLLQPTVRELAVRGKKLNSTENGKRVVIKSTNLFSFITPLETTYLHLHRPPILQPIWSLWGGKRKDGSPTILRMTILRTTNLWTTNLRTTNLRRRPFSERPISENDQSSEVWLLPSRFKTFTHSPGFSLSAAPDFSSLPQATGT